MLPSVRAVKPPNPLAWKQINSRPLQGHLPNHGKACRICDHAKHLHSSAKLQYEAVHWSQSQLDSLRTLFAAGKRIADVAVTLKKTKYSVNQISRYDNAKKGWYTPERPIDIPEFRRQNSARVDAGDGPDSTLGDGVKRRPWSKVEDDRAFEALDAGVPLEDIAAELGRSKRAVRTRLNRAQSGPEVQPFSAKEDALILALRGDARMAQELRALMPHRSEEEIRAQAVALGVARYLKAKPWTHKEVVKLWQLRANDMPFSEIALHLPGRTTSSCRFKYRHTPEHLRPTIEKIGATPSAVVAEDE